MGSEMCIRDRNTTACSVRIKRSCGLSSVTSKGTLAFQLPKERGGLVAINLEVLIVPNLGASIFPVGALHEKGVKLDLFSVPLVLRYGNHVFPNLTQVPRMYVVHIIADAQEITPTIFHTTVDADAWHRRMGHYHPRALKQLAEKPTTGVKLNRNIEAGDGEVCAVLKARNMHTPRPIAPASIHDLPSSTLTCGASIPLSRTEDPNLSPCSRMTCRV